MQQQETKAEGLQVLVLMFGIAAQIAGATRVYMPYLSEMTVADLKTNLESVYPELLALKSYMVAVNKQYANANLSLHVTDEIAIIPPVSGG